MVFLSQPVDVGFSYSTEGQTYNDANSAVDNVLIVKEFFKKFPERAGNDFYLASESYGGHYIPQWTLLLFEEPQYSSTFKGYLVGNPYTGFGSGDIAWANTLWGLQLVPYPTYAAFLLHRCAKWTNDPWSYTPECYFHLNNVLDMSGKLNPYALTYPTCPSGSSLKKQGQQMQKLTHKVRQHLTDASTSPQQSSFDQLRAKGVSTKHLQGSPRSSKRVSNAFVPLLPDEVGDERIQYDACTESYIEGYLNAPDVREALHATESTHLWSECSDPVRYRQYTCRTHTESFDHTYCMHCTILQVFQTWPIADYYADTIPSYTEIFNSPKRSKDFRMMVFSGDVDGICATWGTQSWVYDIVRKDPMMNVSTLGSSSPGISSVRAMWRPYSVSGQQAGYVTRFEDNLAFATVHSAGHEVPGYQPRRALALYNMFLNGSVFDSQPYAPSEQSSDSVSWYNADSLMWLAVAVVFTTTAVITVLLRSKIRSALNSVNTYNLVETSEATENPVVSKEYVEEEDVVYELNPRPDEDPEQIRV
jgi:hypothetical protein